MVFIQLRNLERTENAFFFCCQCTVDFLNSVIKKFLKWGLIDLSFPSTERQTTCMVKLSFMSTEILYLEVLLTTICCASFI